MSSPSPARSAAELPRKVSAPAPGQDGERLWEREAQIEAIRSEAAAGRNLLVYGAPGAGKTAVLRSALRGHPRKPLFCGGGTAASFYRQALAAARAPRPVPAGVRSSFQCRHLLEQQLRSAPYSLVWDPAPVVSRVVANSLRDLLRSTGTPLLAAANSPHMEDIGFLSIFFALRQERLEIPPLSEAAARAFFRQEFRSLELEVERPEPFERDVLHLSQGLPGAIRGILRMAALPRYRCGAQVKLHLIYLDRLMGARSGSS